MKKIFFVFMFVLVVSGILAQTRIYTPSLVSPSNSAVDQMPNVLLNWEPVTGDFGLYYKIQIDTNSLFINPIILTSAVTTVNAHELLFGEKYFWRVKAIDDSDSSYWSAVRNFTVINTVALELPDNGAKYQLPNALLTWYSITGLTNYDYQIDTIINFNSTHLISGFVNGSAIGMSSSQLLYGTKYYWRIRARHSADTSLWSSVWSFATIDTIPSAPNLVLPENLATELSPNNVLLDWDPVLGINLYKIELDTNNSFPNPLKILFFPTPIDLTSLDSGLIWSNNSKITLDTFLFGQTYYWRMKAIGTNDSSFWSPKWSFTTLDTMPNAPNLISPEDLAINQMPNTLLEWSAISGATSYMIEIDTNSLFQFSDTLTSTNTSVNTQELLFAEKYFWRVKAINSTDSSDWSTARNFTVINTVGLISPVNNATGQMLDVSLKWDSITGITNYITQIDTSLNFNSTLLISDTDNVSQINLDTLLFKTKYYWRVKTMHNIDTSSWSSIWFFTSLDTMPGSPNLISPEDLATNQMPDVLLEWAAISGATSYMIELDTNSLFLFSDTLISVNTSVNTQELLFGKKYFWRVKALNSTDSSAWSLTRSFTVIDTLNQIYPNDGVTNQSLSLILKWDAVTGVTYYSCEVDTTNNFNSSQYNIISVSSDLPETQAFAVQSLFGTKYYWRVRAIHNSDASAWSQVRTFITVNNATLIAPYDGADDMMPDVFLRCNSIAGVPNYDFEIDTIADFNSFEYSFTVADDNLPYVQISNNELLFGTKYYWRVRAKYNSSNTSDWTSVWYFTVIDKANLTYPADGATDIEVNPGLKWEEITGINYYEIQYDTLPGFNNPVVDTSSIDTIEIGGIGGLARLKTYYWRVRAIHSRDTSEWSPEFSFTTEEGVNIKELTNQSNINIYPNPTKTGKIFVKIELNSLSLSPIHLSVMNILGQTLIEKNIYPHTGLNTKEINLENLDNGIYLIRLQNKEDVYTHKIIVNR